MHLTCIFYCYTRVWDFFVHSSAPDLQFFIAIYMYETFFVHSSAPDLHFLLLYARVWDFFVHSSTPDLHFFIAIYVYETFFVRSNAPDLHFLLLYIETRFFRFNGKTDGKTELGSQNGILFYERNTTESRILS